MRGWVVCALLLAGCQSAPSPDLARVNPSPARVAASRTEPSEEKKLDRPPASRAKDLAPPVESPETGSQSSPTAGENPESAAPADLPSPSVTTIENNAAPTPSYPQADTTSSPLETPMPVREEAPSVAAAAPALPRPPASGLPTPARPPGFPGRPQTNLPPGAIAPAPPQLPGQMTPPRNPAYDSQRERELERDYRQSRADALNLKYHRGRPVLHADSPEVVTSSQAPLPPGLPPSIPGQPSVVDAFKKSEVQRQEWRSYQQQPGLPQR